MSDIKITRALLSVSDKTGLVELGRTLARHGVDLDPMSEVLITSGATEAIAGAILAIVQPGDEVVIFQPFYDAYVPLVRLAGGPEAESASLEEVRAALLEIDGNGDGRVARGEFDAKVRKGMTGIDRFGTLLAGMDDDGDELISAPELDRWLERRDVDADGRLVMRERDRPGLTHNQAAHDPLGDDNEETYPHHCRSARADRGPRRRADRSHGHGGRLPSLQLHQRRHRRG